MARAGRWSRKTTFSRAISTATRLQGSFVRKLLEDLTPNRPFGYETSFSVSLQDHTARKSEALLEAKASAAIADAAAFIFIDAIDPVGTVNPHAHERMGRVFDRLMPYYRELGGERVADIGLFYSLDSRFDMRSNGPLRVGGGQRRGHPHPQHDASGAGAHRPPPALAHGHAEVPRRTVPAEDLDPFECASPG
jgi:hypothetical protein